MRMSCLETPENHNLSDTFRTKCTLSPEIIHLRIVSQEKHVRRMQSAYQMKQTGNGGKPCSLAPCPNHNRCRSFYTTARNTGKRESDATHINIGVRTGSYAGRENGWNGSGDRRENKRNTPLKGRVSKSSNNSSGTTTIIQSSIRNGGFENKTSKVIHEDTADEIPVEDFIKLPHERQKILTPELTLEKGKCSKNYSQPEKALSKSFELKCRILKSNKSLSEYETNSKTEVRRYSRSVNGGETKIPNESITPVKTDGKKGMRPSKIPISVRRLSGKNPHRYYAKDSFSIKGPAMTENTNNTFPDGKSVCGTEFSSDKNIALTKNNDNVLDLFKDSSCTSPNASPRQSGSVFSNRTFTSSSGPKSNESPTLSLLNRFDITDVESNDLLYSNLEATEINKKTSFLLGFEIDLKRPEPEEIFNIPKSPYEPDDWKDNSQPDLILDNFLCFDPTKDGVCASKYQNRDSNDLCDWGELDDGSYFSSNECFSNDEDYSTESGSASVRKSALECLDEPLHYSMLLPRRELSKSRSMLGIDEKINNSLKRTKTKKNKKKCSNKKRNRKESKSRKDKKQNNSGSKKK